MLEETFDAEVQRALFTTGLFHFDKGARLRRMSVKYLHLWLRARIARLAPHEQDALSSVVTGVTKLLLAGTPTIDYEKRRLDYVESLCHAVAHNFKHCFSPFLKAMFETDKSSLIGVSDLLSAATAVGDIQKVRDLLRENPSFWDRSPIFGSASANAARMGNLDMLVAIIATSTHSEDKVISTSLIAACCAGHQDIVEYLLSHPLQSLFTDHDIENSLEATAAYGHPHVFEVLLPRLSQIRRNVVLPRSLAKASANGHFSTVQYLLHLGTDLNSWEPPGSALHHAANSGFSRVVRLLLDHGADPNFWAGRNGEPLYFAARNGHTEVVRILLEHGANINAKANIYNAISRAARNGELIMVKYLLDQGVDLMARRQGNRALGEAAGQGHEDIVKLLVGYGVDINGNGRHSQPPMHWAVVYGQERIVQLLLQLGAKEQDPAEG